MIALLNGYNAVRWTGPVTAIGSLPEMPFIERIYATNPQTGVGYVGYHHEDAYPTLTTLLPGFNYLVFATAPLTLATAEAAPGAFASFPGYVAASSPAAPAVTGPANVVLTATAAEPVAVGRLVARVPAGVVHYSAMNADHRQRLLGIALSSAVAGGSISVQQRGTVLIPGLGLEPQVTLLAGDNGALVTVSSGMVFHHVVGRALTTDSLFLNPQTTYLL